MPRKSRFEDEIGDLNLVPIMGLIVLLIPMLLLMVVFTQIGVININAPKLSVGPAQDDPPDEEKKPLNLTVGISEKGYTIAATGGVLPGQEQQAEGDPAAGQAGPTIPSSTGGPCQCGDGEVCPAQCGDGNVCRSGQCVVWDYPALYNRMIEIKEAYPDENLVNVGADDRVAFGTLVTTIDAFRVRLEKDAYTEAKAFDEANAKSDSEGRPELLFADVVMAVIQ